VAARLARNGGETQLGTGLVETGPGGQRLRRVHVNGAPVEGSEALLEHLRVVWLTPAMDGLFAGPAAERRRFLDRLVLTMDAEHARRTRDLESLLTQRNRLLGERAEPKWLDALEAQLAASAVAVAAARAQAAALLSARLAEPRADGIGLPAGRMRVAGGFEEALAGRSAAEAEIGYRGALAAGRAADREAGRTLAGPHRSDLDVRLAANDAPAALCSTGEQKALLLGLVLAHAEIVAEASGMMPILLLDEAAAYLDPARRKGLFGRLAATGCQVFMTGADAAIFDPLKASAECFCVAAGTIVPEAASVPF
jgi:DNA replication and repair protein RecF